MNVECQIYMIFSGYFLRKRSPEDLLERALAAFKRDVQLQLHKVHLLCLLARGMLLSQQCNHPTPQGVLLSLAAVGARDLVLTRPSGYSNTTLLKLVKWFSKESDGLRAAVRRECGGREVDKMSEVQLMVCLLRSLGLRSRFVMVLHPLPPKLPLRRRDEGKEGKSKGVAKETGMMSCDGVGARDREGNEEGADPGTGFGERLLQFNLRNEVLKKSESTVEVVGTSGGDTSSGNRTHSGTKTKPHSGTKTEPHSGTKTEPHSGTKKRSNKAGTKGKDVGVVSGGVTSPYFRKREGGREGQTTGRGGHNSRTKTRRSTAPKRSESPEFVVEDEASQEEDFTIPARKRKRKTVRPTPTKKAKKETKPVKTTPTKKATPIEKLKRAAAESVNKNFPTTSHKTASKRIEAKGGQGSSTEVECIGVEETGSWAEVYLPSRRLWSCVHLFSCTVDQPQFCEKHCTIPLHYVVAFEKSE